MRPRHAHEREVCKIVTAMSLIKYRMSLPPGLKSARRGFTGPRRQGSIDELIELESHVGETE